MRKIHPQNRERVLILAPIGQDARLAAQVLEQAGISSAVCADIKMICAAVEEGSGALLLAEEALNLESIVYLRDCLGKQPPWSDLSVILMTSRGSEKKSREFINAFGEKASVHLLERTFRPVTLVSVVQMALRARRRQYEMSELFLKLKESEERYSQAVKGSSAGVWEWDFSSDQIFFSPEWKAMLGEEGEKISKEQWRKRLHPEDAHRTFQYMRDLKPDETGAAEKNYDLEYRLMHKDGEYRHILSRGTVFFDKEGRALRLAGSHIDITERKRGEEKLLKLTAELNASNRELEQFAYAASHDLQEPLRVISMYLEIFMDSYGRKIDEEGRSYLRFAQEGSARSQRLVSDLLQYAKIGLKVKEFEIVPLDGVLKEALDNLQITVTENRAEITQDPLPETYANRGALTQLFQNLLSNAIKYRSDRAVKIHVSCRRKGDEWVIGVSDNGMGIDPRYQERIFGIFQRLDTRKDISGTGIGLALCKKIAERHGGKIWVESKTGEGSSFYFTLPVVSGSADITGREPFEERAAPVREKQQD